MATGAEIYADCCASSTTSTTFGATSARLSRVTTSGVSVLATSGVASVGGQGSTDNCLESSHVGSSTVVGSSRPTSSLSTSNSDSKTTGCTGGVVDGTAIVDLSCELREINGDTECAKSDTYRAI